MGITVHWFIVLKVWYHKLICLFILHLTQNLLTMFYSGRALSFNWKINLKFYFTLCPLHWLNESISSQYSLLTRLLFGFLMLSGGKWIKIGKSLAYIYLLKIKQWRQWHRSGVFIVNFEHIAHLFSNVYIVDIEQVNVSWKMV